MDWHAVEQIDEAVEDSKELLFPLERSTWLRLAVIVFFLGGTFSLAFQPQLLGMAAGSNGLVQESGVQGNPGTASLTGLSPDLLFFGIAAAAALLGLLYSYLSAVFEFVFYRSLHEEEVRIRKNMSRYAGHGLKLLGLRALMLLGFMLALIFTVFLFSINPLAGGILLFLLVPLGISLWLLDFAIMNIAVPGIAVEDTGFLEAVREAVSLMSRKWKQVGLFILLKFVLGIAVGMIAAFGVIVGILILLIPLALVGLLLGIISPVLLVFPVALGILGILAISVIVAIPLKTFIRRWVLNVSLKLED